MAEETSLKKNMVMSFILTVSNFLFPLITYTYVARVITPVGIGKVAFVDSILQYFIYFARLGIPAYGLRECAKVRDDKEKLSALVKELLTINIIVTILSYVALVTTIMCVPKLQEYRLLFLVMSSSILLNTMGIEWLYQALEKYTYITIRSLVFKIISVLLTFLLIKSTDDYLWYGFLTIFTVGASNVLNFVNARKIVSIRTGNRCDLKKHLKPIFVLFSASIIITIYSNFDVSMLGFIKTENEVGLYNSALKIKTILLSLSTAVTSVIVPRMAYYIKNKNKEKSEELIIKSLRVSLLLAFPIAVYVLLYAKDIILFVCGSEYIDAVPTLRVLMICIIPLILTNLFGNQILIPSGDEKRYSQSVFVGLFINLIMNFMLIPVLGVLGAAIGTLFTEIWNAIWMSSGAKNYLSLVIKNIKYCTYILSLFCSILLSYFISNFFVDLMVFFRLCITSCVCFGSYYLVLMLLNEPIINTQLAKIKLYVRKR